jgi:hypothetical protein
LEPAGLLACLKPQNGSDLASFFLFFQHCNSKQIATPGGNLVKILETWVFPLRKEKLKRFKILILLKRKDAEGGI